MYKKYGNKERRNKNIIVEDFAEELSKQFNLPKNVIISICRSEFEYVNKVMEEGRFESIRLMYLGIFGISKYRMKYIPEEVLERIKSNGGKIDQNDNKETKEEVQ